MFAITPRTTVQRWNDRGSLFAGQCFGDFAMVRDVRVFRSEESSQNHRQLARTRARMRVQRQAAGGEIEVAAVGPARRLAMVDILPGAHRTNTPVRTPSKTRHFSKPMQGVPAAESGESAAVREGLSVDPRILALSAEVAARTVRLVVPVHQRALYASLPLRAWYDCPLYGPGAQRLKDIKGHGNADGTMEKDLSAISVWERFTRPPDWLGEWPGISISAISEDYLRTWITTALAGGLSRGYLEGLANHLSWILSIAVDREVLSKKPKKPAVRQIAAARSSQLFSEDDDLAVIFETNGQILETLDRIHGHLAGQFELQTAFVLAVSTGLRPSDMFSLVWSDLRTIDGTPAIVKTPEKTKRHGTTVRIPLAACVARRLEELRVRAEQNLEPADPIVVVAGMASDHIFPTLVSHDAKDPEKSRAARRRNAAISAAAEAAGFAFPARRRKPWQIARATANERLERHCPGIGEFVLGHAAGTINKKHYRQRWSEAVNAIATLPQPPSFLDWSQGIES